MHPGVAGVPWWGAVLISLTATAIGFAFDAGAGTKELTNVFAALYVIGCVAAVLAVRQAGLFTAVVQPPVLLFISVPGAYFLFHGAEINGLKDILINCGYPLIERFPLMLFSSAGVLLIGLARAFLGHKSGDAEGADATAAAEPTPRALLNGLAAKVSGLFAPSSGDDEAADTGKRRHAIDRTSSPAKKSMAKPARTSRTAKTPPRAQASRSRHARTPLADVTEIIEPVTERPRRPRTPRQDPPPEPRRRRAPAARTGRDPYERRERYERRAPHDRRSRYDAYDPFASYEPPRRRRPGTDRTNGTDRSTGTTGIYGTAGVNPPAAPNPANGTHHPISKVRYRGSGISDNGRPEPTARRSRFWQADTWEYDI